MVHRKALVRAAACAALACAGLVRAENAMSAGDDGLTLKPAFLDAATEPATMPAAATPDTAPASAPAAPTPKPLMYLLKKANASGPLDALNTTIGGYVEGGYTLSFQHPPGNVIQGRFQDTKHERVVLDQADFSVDRPVDPGAAATNHTFDIGYHMDFIYGWDTGLFHSSGILDNPAVPGVSSGTYQSRTHPENQPDFTQAYLTFALPVGNGLKITAGKFVTLLGWEYINSTQNAFYSHSFLFTYAIPLTQTGVLADYKLNNDFEIQGGVTRGWSQSLRDNNGAADFLGNVTWTPQESDFLKLWKVVLGVSEGPQATHDNSDYWSVFDLQVSYQMTGDGSSPGSLQLALNADYGDAPHAFAGVGKSAQWFGAAGYVQYIATPMITVNGRLEWYDDNNGFTLGTAGAENVYEATFGLDVKPFPTDDIMQNLVIRPEVRVDYADKPYWNAGTKHTQVTFGVDAYFVF